MSPILYFGADNRVMKRQTPFPDLPAQAPDEHVLAAYLLGEASPHERERVEAWMRVSEENAESLALLRQGWEVSAPSPVAGNLSAFLANIRHDIETVTPSRVREPAFARAPGSRLKKWGWFVATTTACVIGAFVIWGQTFVSPARTTAAAIFQTVAAQQAHITLTDGSRVTLAPNSRLTVTTAFGDETRTVHLDGDGFFDIRPGATPFIVQARGVATRVLGTTFGVQANSYLTAVRITVLDGKVAATSAGGSVTVTAGMSAELTDSSVTAATVQDPEAYVSWRRGQLVFSDTPVPELLLAVGRWYGYELRLADTTLRRERVSTVLNVAAREETFRALSQLLNVTLSMQDSVITLHPRRMNRSLKRVTPDRNTQLYMLSTEVGK